MERPARPIYFDPPTQHSKIAFSTPMAPASTTQAIKNPSASPTSSGTLSPEPQIVPSASNAIIPDYAGDADTKKSSGHASPYQIMNTGKGKETKSNHDLRSHQTVPLHHLYHISGANSPAFSLAERAELAFAAANPSPKVSPVRYEDCGELTNDDILEQYMKEMENATWCGFDLENEDEELEEDDNRSGEGFEGEHRGEGVVEGSNDAGCACEKCGAGYGSVVRAIRCTSGGHVLTERDRERLEAVAGMELPAEDD